MSIELLRKAVPQPLINRLWQRARSGQYPARRSCPACKRRMAEVHVAPAADKVLHLDLATFGNLEAAVKNWGLIPAEFARHYGLTFITSFFLHGGLVHLIGNVAVFAHLGGADAGVVFWLWTRRSLSMDTAPPLTEPARTI